MHANAALLCQVVAVSECMSTLAALHTCFQASNLHTSTLPMQGHILRLVAPVDSFVKVALLELLP